MPAVNLSNSEQASGTFCRRRQRNLLAVAVFLLAAILPVALCFAANPAGETKKADSAPAPLALGAYFGLKLPGETPEIFAPGIISIPGRNSWAAGQPRSGDELATQAQSLT
jgi:hypothetical protein